MYNVCFCKFTFDSNNLFSTNFNVTCTDPHRTAVQSEKSGRCRRVARARGCDFAQPLTRGCPPTRGLRPDLTPPLPSQMLSFVVTSSCAYSAPAVVGRAARAAVSMNIADLPGAGEETLGKVFDPLGLSDMQPYGSANQEWMRTAEVRARSARARPRAAPARQQLRRRSAAQ